MKNAAALFINSLKGQPTMKRILPLIALAFLTIPASAQQQFNPDASAYGIMQNASDLAKYANLLKQQIAEDQKQIADLQKQIADLAKKPKEPAAQ